MTPRTKAIRYLRRASLHNMTCARVAEGAGISLSAARRMRLSELVDDERARRYEARQYKGRDAMLKRLGFKHMATFDQWHVRQYGRRWYAEFLVHVCTRDDMADIAELRAKGYPVGKIARLAGYHPTTTRRYLRIYDQYGIGAFVPREMAA